jgi:hypothetical protein
VSTYIMIGLDPMKVTIFWILALLFLSSSRASFYFCHSSTHLNTSEQALCHGERAVLPTDSLTHSQEDPSSRSLSSESCCYLSSCCQSSVPQNKSTIIIQVAEESKTFFVPALTPNDSPFVPLEPPKS